MAIFPLGGVGEARVDAWKLKERTDSNDEHEKHVCPEHYSDVLSTDIAGMVRARS